MNKGEFLAMRRQNTRLEPFVLRAFDGFETPLAWIASIVIGLSVIDQIVIWLARVLS